MSNISIHVFNENFIDLSLYQCGMEQCDPGHAFGPASREHYLFHYVIRNRGRLYANDHSNQTKKFSVEAGQGFLIFPNQLTTYVADAEEPWEYMWLEFDGVRVRESLQQTNLSLDQPIYSTESADLRDRMAAEMRYIGENPSHPMLDLIGHLYLFFDCFIRSAHADAPVRSSRMSDFYVRAAVGFIEKNFARKITIEEIAAVCGIDRSYFGKIFHKAMGSSPQEFLMNYRMVKASELLKHTDMAISDIAAAVGYENPLHFSRAFKKSQGTAPRNWRNQHRK